MIKLFEQWLFEKNAPATGVPFDAQAGVIEGVKPEDMPIPGVEDSIQKAAKNPVEAEKSALDRIKAVCKEFLKKTESELNQIQMIDDTINQVKAQTEKTLIGKKIGLYSSNSSAEPNWSNPEWVKTLEFSRTVTIGNIKDLGGADDAKLVIELTVEPKEVSPKNTAVGKVLAGAKAKLETFLGDVGGNATLTFSNKNPYGFELTTKNGRYTSQVYNGKLESLIKSVFYTIGQNGKLVPNSGAFAKKDNAPASNVA